MREQVSSTSWALAAVPFGLILLRRDSFMTGARAQFSDSPSIVELGGTLEASQVLELPGFLVAGGSHWQATSDGHHEDIQLVSEVATTTNSMVK